MKKNRRITVWEKVERDMALNISELVEVSGYNRASLRQMKLPLVCGKIPYSDFRVWEIHPVMKMEVIP